MKLNKLTTEVDGKIIREIVFNDTLNIITNRKDSKLSGNQIGKSVPGRIIDFLLDGSISPIYIDEEFNTPELNIEKLFSEYVVTSSLSYIGFDGEESNIKRRLSTDKSLQLYYIDDIEKNKHDYVCHILKTMFNVSSAKPTIRKLAPKFLRIDSNRMTKTVKFNDDKFPISKADRNTLFLYLFNFSDTEVLSKIQKLKTLIVNHEGKLSSFNGVIKEDRIVSNIAAIRKELARLERSLLLTENSDDKIAIIQKINCIDDKQNRLSDSVLTLELKINNVLKTKALFENNRHYQLLDELDTIYKYASVKIDSVINDYKKVLEFHEHLLDAKSEYITDGLDDIRLSLKEKTEEIKLLSTQKDMLYRELKSKKKIDEISDSIKEIGELNKKFIELTAIVDKKDSIQMRLNDEKENLDKLSSDLNCELKNVHDFEAVFKNNFKYYTNKFYGVEYNFSLNLNPKNGDCDPSVDDTQSNNDGGLKRLEAISFDLTYIKSVSDLNLLRPTFVVHDSIDEVDIKHIRQLFDESMKLPGQHILSMLSSQLEDEDYEKYKAYIVLELSQQDKFFLV